MVTLDNGALLSCRPARSLGNHALNAHTMTEG
jgi:hypothetical protein